MPTFHKKKKSNAPPEEFFAVSLKNTAFSKKKKEKKYAPRKYLSSKPHCTRSIYNIMRPSQYIIPTDVNVQ